MVAYIPFSLEEVIVWAKPLLRPRHRFTHQHAGGRCMLKRRTLSLCRNGTKLAKSHQTLRPISLSAGENSKIALARRLLTPAVAQEWEIRQITGDLP